MSQRFPRLSRNARSLYFRFRSSGESALWSLRHARAMETFQRLEDRGRARIIAQPEEENYFDVFGRENISAREDAEIARQIEVGGCWVTIAQVKCSSCGAWQTVNSCGMHVGYDDVLSPFDNPYVADHMLAIVDSVKARGRRHC